MRTLSIRQPWAWLIVNGHKPVENRDWSTDFRGRFLIHAGSQMVRRDYWSTVAQLKDELGIEVPHFLDLPMGGIVGAATLVDVVTEMDNPFFLGPFGFVLKDARPLPFVPFKGQLGWFNTPARLVLDAVRAAEQQATTEAQHA
ncbi:MAG: ASCH domain-containing protein [Roseateles sp.]